MPPPVPGQQTEEEKLETTETVVEETPPEVVTEQPPPEPPPSPELKKEIDPRALDRIIAERNEERERNRTLYAKVAEMEERLKAPPARQEAAETTEQRRARYDTDPYQFFNSEMDRRDNYTRSRSAWDSMLGSSEGRADPQFVTRIRGIIDELALESDQPERDAIVAMQFYRSRYPGKTPARSADEITKESLKSGKKTAGPAGTQQDGGALDDEQLQSMINSWYTGGQARYEEAKKQGRVPGF